MVRATAGYCPLWYQHENRRGAASEVSVPHIGEPPNEE